VIWRAAATPGEKTGPVGQPAVLPKSRKSVRAAGWRSTAETAVPGR
jgi:hypothetical protein